MSILRRHLAPLTEEAWSMIENEARGVLEANLSARTFVDVIGPRGWDFAAVNLGRLGDTTTTGKVGWGLRRVLPLIEFRVPFALDKWEVDNISRGGDDVDLGPLRAAAREAARFEESVVYRGLPETPMSGLAANSEHPALQLPDGAHGLPDVVAIALMRLADAGVDGPHLLVLGDREYRTVAGDAEGYPTRKRLAGLVGSAPVYSPGLEGALVVSRRGGDFRLDLGVDMAIGFDHADATAVHLYMTESFAFRVTGPEAVIRLDR
jgi:uncharacterized linocin/CFP29 family protein